MSQQIIPTYWKIERIDSDKGMHFTSKILHTVCLALDTNWKFHTPWHSQISRYVERYGSWPVWSNHRLKAMGKILLVVTGKVRGAIAHWSGYAIIYNIVCWQAVHIKLLFLKVPHSFPDWLYFAAVFYIFVITVSHWTFTLRLCPNLPFIYSVWSLAPAFWSLPIQLFTSSCLSFLS